MSARAWFRAAVVLDLLVLGWAAWVLPDGPVPLHFGVDGTPDRWGSSAELLWTLGAVGLGTAAVFAGVAALVGSGRVPMALVDIPHKEHWSRPARRVEAFRRLAEDLQAIGAMTMLLLAVLGLLVVDAARTRDPLGPWGWAVVAAYALGLLAWVVTAYTCRYRPPGEPEKPEEGMT